MSEAKARLEAENALLKSQLRFRQDWDPVWQSAIECLREIADMGKKAGSETAKNWLIKHQLARVEGGYVPGKGFVDNSTAILATPQHQPDTAPVPSPTSP
jgi:hypothetical protein